MISIIKFALLGLGFFSSYSIESPYQGPYVKKLIGHKEAISGEYYSLTIKQKDFFDWSNQTDNINLTMTTREQNAIALDFYFSKVDSERYLFSVNSSFLKLGRHYSLILVASDNRGRQAGQLWELTVVKSEDKSSSRKQIKIALIFGGTYIGIFSGYLLFIYCRDERAMRRHQKKQAKVALEIPKAEDNEEASEKSTDPSISSNT